MRWLRDYVWYPEPHCPACAGEVLVVEMPVSVVFRPMTFAGVDGEVLAPLFRPNQ